MFTYILYAAATIGLTASFFANKQKTKKSLMKAWKSFENILPKFFVVIIIIGLMLTVVSTETINLVMGADSGALGIFAAAIIGSVTLIPGFVAFPLAAALLGEGAGVAQIAAFVTSLMMVGIVTLPMEIETFGKKATLVRNGASFVFSLIAALVMGVVI